MIAWITGTLLEIDEDRAIVVVSDIGYEILCTRTALQGKSSGDRLELFVYEHATEHATELYGFHSSMEKAIFIKLLSVQGVGPKVALSILSTFGMKEVVRIITGGHEKTLTSAAGVGKKTAQRLIMELRDALLPFREQLMHSMEMVLPATLQSSLTHLETALSGLRNMGYRPQELSAISGALQEAATQDASCAQLIRLGLSLLRKEKP